MGKTERSGIAEDMSRLREAEDDAPMFAPEARTVIVPGPPTKLRMLQTQVEDGVFRAVRAMANESDRTVQQILREALDLLFEKHEVVNRQGQRVVARMVGDPLP
jgi:hypothetical protein